MRQWPGFLLALMLSASSFAARAAELRQPQRIPGGQGKEKLIADPEPNLDGVVEVSFRLDNLGKVQILNINSTSPQLSDYVIKKLSKIQLASSNSEIGKIIKYRFVFKKQA
jgi:hypothetical protein